MKKAAIVFAAFVLAALLGYVTGLAHASYFVTPR